MNQNKETHKFMSKKRERDQTFDQSRQRNNIQEHFNNINENNHYTNSKSKSNKNENENFSPQHHHNAYNSNRNRIPNKNENIRDFGMEASKELPIAKYRKDILDTIEKHQVIIIAGETGCGKTTQVPKYIYESLTGQGKEPNILITQPRRIAAFSIAKRLSIEMKVELGKEVGYHYGMSPVFSSEITKILIVTTGIFLQRIIHEKNLDEYTHILLDEVHERDEDIDFVLVILKNILKENKKIKVILMSATIATNLFANYFARSSIDAAIIKKNEEHDDNFQTNCNMNNNYDVNLGMWNVKQETYNYKEEMNNSNFFTVTSLPEGKSNKFSQEDLVQDSAPIISIKEKIYPVLIWYIDEFISNLKNDLNKSYESSRTNFDIKNPKIDHSLYDIALDLIRCIHNGRVIKEPKKFHVLVFLPGFAEIDYMFNLLYSRFPREENFDSMDILKLHSNLTE
jgi:HrpA-like RNA helicase